MKGEESNPTLLGRHMQPRLLGIVTASPLREACFTRGLQDLCNFSQTTFPSWACHCLKRRWYLPKEVLRSVLTLATAFQKSLLCLNRAGGWLWNVCLSVCLPYLVGLTLPSYGHSLGPWNRCPPHTSMDIHKPSSTRSSAVTCLSDFCGEGFKASFSTPLDFGPCPRKCFLNDRENTFQDTRANDSSPGLNTHPFSPCFYFCLPVSLMLSLMTQCHWTPGCPGSTPKVTPGCCFLHWARL